MKNDDKLLTVGIVLAVLGAGLAFALEDTNESWWIFEVQPLGAVLLAVGVLLIGAVMVSRMGGSAGGPGGAADHRTVKALSGLIAVVAGVTAVAALAIVTLSQLSDESDSVVAVTTSAFGVISAVIGAYLGIKMSTDATEQLGQQAETAAVAQHEATVKDKGMEARKTAAENLVGAEKADQIDGLGREAEQAARAAAPFGGAGAA